MQRLTVSFPKISPRILPRNHILSLSVLLEIPASRREVRAAQFGGFGGFGGFSGSASQANADSQSFNQGGGFPSFPKHFGGSAANAGASSQSFEDGGFGGFGGSAANAGAQSQSFEQVSIPPFSASQTKITFKLFFLGRFWWIRRISS